MNFIENKLILKIAKGDQDAFLELYHLYKEKVYNTAISYLQNVEEAEELTQDVFVTIFNKADTFQGKSKVGTWIYRITVNKSLNQLKKRKKKFINGEIQEYHSIDFTHPGLLLENKEKGKYLFKGINLLPENQKTAFILSYIEEVPRKEVAEIMNTSLKAVESLLQRAKVNLRKEIICIYPEGNQKK